MSHAVKPDAPVLIVGSGPVGLFQAYMLAKLGGELSLCAIAKGSTCSQPSPRDPCRATHRTIGSAKSARIVASFLGDLPTIWSIGIGDPAEASASGRGKVGEVRHEP